MRFKFFVILVLIINIFSLNFAWAAAQNIDKQIASEERHRKELDKKIKDYRKQIQEMGAKVKSLLEKMCPVEIEENLPGARWSKLLINATFSGLGTVMGGTFGDVTHDPAGRELAVRCMKEVIDVGRACGVTFAPVQGKNITALFYWRNPVKKAAAKLLLPVAMKKHAAIEPSMLQDLKKGKPCEIRAINGVVCERGKRAGVATPVNDRIVALVTEIQEGKRKPSRENLKDF